MVRALPTGLGALLLGACAHTPPPPPAMPGAEAPRTLDERLDALSRPKPAEDIPVRPPEELRAMIDDLQTERTKLLLRFTEQHPSVVQLDRKIERLQTRLQAAEEK